MMFGPNSATRTGLTNNENLFPLIKRTWDPVAQSLMQHRSKKLPGNPVLLIVPSTPNFRTSQSRRLHNWITSLNHLGMVVVVHTSTGKIQSRFLCDPKFSYSNFLTERPGPVKVRKYKCHKRGTYHLPLYFIFW